MPSFGRWRRSSTGEEEVSGETQTNAAFPAKKGSRKNIMGGQKSWGQRLKENCGAGERQPFKGAL